MNNQLQSLTYADNFLLYQLESGLKLFSHVTGVNDKFCTTLLCAITPPILGKVTKHIPVDINVKLITIPCVVAMLNGHHVLSLAQ